MSAALSPISSETLAARVSRTLRTVFGAYRYPHQRVADLAGGDVRAARNWWDGTNPPTAATLLTMMRECPELRAEIDRLLDGDAAP